MALKLNEKERFLNDAFFAKFLMYTATRESELRIKETALLIMAAMGSKDISKEFSEYVSMFFPTAKEQEQQEIQEGIELLKKLLQNKGV